jgi:hypothetical protein
MKITFVSGSPSSRKKIKGQIWIKFEIFYPYYFLENLFQRMMFSSKI